MIVDALEQECAGFDSAIRSLEESDYARPTNCPPWNLKELVAHVLGSTCVDLARLPTAAQDADVQEAADYYRRSERDAASYRQGNVDRWQQIAKRFTSGLEVAETFRTKWPKLIADARSTDLTRLIEMSWGAAMSLENYLVSRVIGVAAHGVDVSITLGRPRWTTRPALDVALPTLTSLLGAEPPASLNWTDQDMLEIGTGRRHLAESERLLLGPLAERFPLLS